MDGYKLTGLAVGRLLTILEQIDAQSRQASVSRLEAKKDRPLKQKAARAAKEIA